MFCGVIVLVVNGVFIFNVLNNCGEDVYLVGELDDFGGHVGCVDDYYYYIVFLYL